MSIIHRAGIYRTGKIRTVLTVLLLLAVLCPSVLAQERKNIRRMRYDHYRARSDKAYDEKNFKESIFYRQLILKMFPNSRDDHYYLSCLHALNGQKTQALDSLEEAVRYGWDNAAHMKRDSDMDALREEARFKELLAAAKACANEKKFVYRPASADKNKSNTLLVALSGYGGNPRGFAGEWTAVADRLGIPVAALKGRGKTPSPGIFGWHRGENPRDLDVEGTAELIDEAAKDLGVDPADVIVVGFSQGGAVALKLMAEYPGKYRGALTISAGDDVEAFRKWIASAKEATIRVFMIAGKLDKHQPHSSATMKVVNDAGVKLKYVQLPAVGHEMPADSTDLYVEAIQFLTDDD